MKTIKALVSHTIMVKENTISPRFVMEIPESDDCWKELRLQADTKATEDYGIFGEGSGK